MVPRDLRLSVFALIFTAFSVPLLGSNESGPPQGITPTLGVVSKVSKLGNNIICEWTSTRLTVMAGNSQENAGAAGKGIAGHFDSSPVSFYEVRGSKILAERVASRVKPGDVVVVSEDGRMPERRYLQVFKDEVLVLVRVPLDAPLTPVPDVSDPKGRIPPQILPPPQPLPER
jgi:hypothetical protein